MRRTLLMVTLLAGCFAPNLTDVIFTCSETKPGCPPGGRCDYEAGCCKTPSNQCMKGTSGGPDMPAAPIDFASDLAAGGIPANCDMLLPGDPRLLRCRGTFAKGQAASLCPVGFHLTTEDRPAPAPVVNACQDQAQKDPHVFLANRFNYRGTQWQTGGSCDPSTPGVDLKWSAYAGCGLISPLFESDSGVCGSWNWAVMCRSAAHPASPISCSGKNLAMDVDNGDPLSGVLCTRNGATW